MVGYGSMLIEGALAVVSLITAAYLTQADYAALGNPTLIFSNGVATFMSSFGIPFETGQTFVALAVSAFALTSLDTATRIGRFVFQEFFQTVDEKTGEVKGSIISNMYVATAITVALGGALGLTGYAKVWPIFGSANQLLAALALLAVAVWLKKQGRNFKMIVIPMIFMFTVTILALILLIYNNAITLGTTGNPILLVVASALLILAVILVTRASKQLRA